MADGDFLDYWLGPVEPAVLDVQITGNAERKLVETFKHYMPLLFDNEKIFSVKGRIVVFDFINRKLAGSPLFVYNKATYKNEIEFGFYFHMDFKEINIVVVLDQPDREKLERKENFEMEFIESLVLALLAEILDERIKKHEADVALAWEQLLRFPAFRRENIKVVKTAEEFSVNVTGNPNPVSVTSLKDSDMFMIKFQNIDDEKHGVLKAFSRVLEKSAELQTLKHPDREVFTNMHERTIRSKFILALYTRAKKRGVPFWEMNGYVLFSELNNRGRISWLQSFLPDAATQKQYHKVGKSNLFGTMLISLAENILFKEGAEYVELDALETATSFYEQLGYVKGPAEDDEDLLMQKVFPRKVRGVFNASSFDLWGPIIENRWRQKDIEAALRLVRGNTVAAAQLMHFYLKKRGKLI